MPTDIKNSLEALPHALHHLNEIFNIFNGRRPVLFLDYDGTLAPIVTDPAKAVMSEVTRNCLGKLATIINVAIVSGRDRKDVEARVGFRNLIYAGSHGYDISGPDNFTYQQPEGNDAVVYLDQATKNLSEQLKSIPGAVVERKKYAIAVHYRNVEEKNVEKVINAVDNELKKYIKLKKGEGKKILELKPGADWHKGKAVLWLMETLNFTKDNFIPVFIGDDITDEDALKSIEKDGLGILVGSHGQETAATFRLDSIEEVNSFLKMLYKEMLDNQH